MTNALGIPRGEKCIGFELEGYYKIIGYKNTDHPRVRIHCLVDGPECEGEGRDEPSFWKRKSDLISGRTKSCGCHRRQITSNNATLHGDTKRDSKYHQLWDSWRYMCNRCGEYTSHSESIKKNYTDKKIKVCEEWQEYLAFKDWALKSGWEPGLSLDRIQNRLGYEPKNCKWVPLKQQGKNTSRVVLHEYQEERKNLTDWSKDSRCLVSYTTLLNRVNKQGKSIAEALTTPSRNQGANRSPRQTAQSIFSGMKARCHNPKNSEYENYGGRGIEICEEWLADPAKFVDWYLDNYQQGLTIERINNHLGYSPSNCRFADRNDQNNNRRNTIFLNIDGRKAPLSEWMQSSLVGDGVKAELVRNRLRNKPRWSDKDALITPKGKRRMG